MINRYHYGFAALAPSADYPDFKPGNSLSCIPCDFFLSEPVGHQLKLFLEDKSQSWLRSSTDSSMVASRELVSKVIAPELKAVSTYKSMDRTRLKLDGIVQVVDFTCLAVSDAVVRQLVSDAGIQHSVLKDWVTEHSSLLSLAGGLVFSAVLEYETKYLDEVSRFNIATSNLRQYLELANTYVASHHSC